MKRMLCLTVLGVLTALSAPAVNNYPISAVEVKNVVLTDNFWLPKIQLIQDSTIRYAFDKCAEEGRMENFLIAGGVKQGKTRGKMPFDDTDLYKIIEGASYSLISKPNPTLDAYLDSVINIIGIGQEKDGYLTTWFTIDPQRPPASWVKPSTRRWQNEVSSHELYNSGHLFEAAAAHFLATGKRNLLDIALKNADLLVANFGPGKLTVPPGHQIVETGLIKLYQLTKKEAYLQLARYFLDWRGDKRTHELYGAYNQDHLPVIDQGECAGHAVRAVYMYAAMTDIAVMQYDEDYRMAVSNLWNNMVNKKMYLTGGIGSKHDGESFGHNFELPNLTAYNETCAAIGSVLWNQRLFLLTGDASYVDIMERTLFNGVIPGISVDGKKFFYPNPLESDGKFAFNQGALTRSSWFDCSCCPTNLIRFLPSIPGLIYATKNNHLYVNMYMSNKATCVVDKETVQIEQQTAYPWKGDVTITLNPSTDKLFTLHVRIPGWANNAVTPGDLYAYTKDNSDAFKVMVNGKRVKDSYRDGYVEINRTWQKGDIIELVLPMKVQEVITTKKLVKDNVGKVAFEYGPLVYCAEQADNAGMENLTVTGNTNFKPTDASLLGNEVVLLKGRAGSKPMTLIPYYLWSNRGVGMMKVWIPKQQK
jgi:uncharacterized protein